MYGSLCDHASVELLSYCHFRAITNIAVKNFQVQELFFPSSTTPLHPPSPLFVVPFCVPCLPLILFGKDVLSAVRTGSLMSLSINNHMGVTLWCYYLQVCFKVQKYYTELFQVFLKVVLGFHNGRLVPGSQQLLNKLLGKTGCVVSCQDLGVSWSADLLSSFLKDPRMGTPGDSLRCCEPKWQNPDPALTKGGSGPLPLLEKVEGLSHWFLRGSSKQGIIVFASPVQSPSPASVTRSVCDTGSTHFSECAFLCFHTLYSWP